MIERVDTRRKRSSPANFDHVLDHSAWTGKYSFYRAVAAIADPAEQPAPVRLMFDKRAIADALDQASHNHVANDSHLMVPASRIDGSQRRSERT